jgi:hypothetical protein
MEILFICGAINNQKPAMKSEKKEPVRREKFKLQSAAENGDLSIYAPSCT